MDIETFFHEFTKELDFLLEEGVIIGKEDIDALEDTNFTLLFDVALYNIARRNGLTLIPERPTGRGGYSDITLCSKTKEKLIEIEHENRPIRKHKGKYAIHKAIDNLMNGDVKLKVLITYTFDDIGKEKLKQLCTAYLNENYPARNNLFLFYAYCIFDNAQKEFKKILL